MAWPTAIPMVAILRGIRPEEVTEHFRALIDEGFDAIEIPLNSPNWQSSIAIAVEKFSSEVLVGAGTVLSVEEVQRLHELGAQFIVTPNTNPAVIQCANELGLYTCIGCITATEAFSALESGAHTLKFFPAGDLGANYIKSLKAVLPDDVPVLAVGGVNADNLNEYLSVGCIGAGLGSDLYKAGQSADVTRKNAKRYLTKYRELTA